MIAWIRRKLGRCVQCNTKLEDALHCPTCNWSNIKDFDEVEPMEDVPTEGKPVYYEE